ncbi:CUB domain-containing protein [Trichonephila clavipes]|nr:CUB domain-containing protein [Trichonephila clavipes]
MINDRTHLHVVANGTMTGQRYIDEVLLPHVRLFRGAVGEKFVYMDDNATCHRTLAVQDCLDSEGIQRLVWPACSPDLNPIENVWDALGRQVAGRNHPPTNKNTLIRALTEEWDKLPQQLLDNVVQSAIFCYYAVCISFQDSVEDNDLIFEEKKITCGQYLNQSSASFHLALPQLPDKTCNWTIEVPPKNSSGIKLFFHFLFLHENDSVTIFKDCESSNNDSLSLIDPLYAQNGSVTVFTVEKSICIKLSGSDTNYIRKFSGHYDSSTECSLPIIPKLQIIHSPIFAKDATGSEIECKYVFNKNIHQRILPSFTFEEFNFTTSTVSLVDCTIDRPSSGEPVDFFPVKNWVTVEIHVSMKPPTTEYFRLKISSLDSACSGHYKFGPHETAYTFESPEEELNNGSIMIGCRYVFENPDTSNILGLQLWKFHFSNPLDIVSINDGGSEISEPLLQVTTSNANLTKSQIVRSTRQYIWMEFKPQTYASKFVANISVHGQGGYMKGNGTLKVNPPVGDDTVFLLEVDQNEVVLLNFTASDFDLPATLSIYDGFDKTNLLAALHGNVWYPVLSKTSKMMVIATNFTKGSFTADFKGVMPGCLQMSTFSNENYILSGNCNNTCLWTIPPQDRPGFELLLHLQYLSLGLKDQLNIYKLDKAKTILGSVHSNVTHIPQLVIPANVGVLVEVNRGPCVKNEDVVVIGHSSYLPVCGKDMTLKASADFQIMSPLYPDTYPLLASCKWKINIDKKNFIHLSFHSMKLVHNHCIKITQLSDNTTVLYDGNVLPEDLFLSSNSIVEFDSTDCKTAKVTTPLESSEGFLLNGTVADCGGVLSGKPNDEFSTDNHTSCIWKVNVPETQDNANSVVNIISYSVNQVDENGNYELHVYDGNSVRDSSIVNDTKSEIWSRTNNLIFVYKRINLNKPSSVLKFKYSTISCNETMQCDNKICLHPDWRCNGINDCGDFSDERNCASVPVPPPVVVKEYGYSSTTFWVTIFIMLALGIGLGVGVPYGYEKYKSGQYRRFDDLSAIH